MKKVEPTKRRHAHRGLSLMAVNRRVRYQTAFMTIAIDSIHEQSECRCIINHRDNPIQRVNTMKRLLLIEAVACTFAFVPPAASAMPGANPNAISSAPKIQSSKYTAGAITVAAAIITDGAEAIMDGATVTIA